MGMKKGFYFSFDAMVGATLIIGAVAIFLYSPAYDQSIGQANTEFKEAEKIAEDTLQVAMSGTVNELLSSSERSDLVNETVLTEDDMNDSLVDAVATLWASNDTVSAEELMRSYFEDYNSSRYDFRVTVRSEGESYVIYASNDTINASETIARSTRLVSGVARNRPVEGYTSKASLTELGALNSLYFFFGGYAGDGNISARLNLPRYTNIVRLVFEGDVREEFELYVNGEYGGLYNPEGGNMSAEKFTVCNQSLNVSVCEELEPGTNNVDIRFPTNGSSIGGGFIRVDYNESKSLESSEGNFTVERDYLPGVNGVINLYSSFHTPGTLEELSARLHVDSNQSIYLKLGNVTVFQENPGGTESTFEINSSTMEDKFSEANTSFSDLSGSTVPVRLGTKNISSLPGRKVDSVSVIDVSGSMDGDKLSEAKSASKDFVDIILNVSNNRAGLVAYESVIDTVHELTTDKSFLKDSIDSLTAYGGTCIGCGILEGTNVVTEPHIEALFSRKSSWKYNTSFPDSEPPNRSGKRWNEREYDDSDWNSSQAIVGFGPDVDSDVSDNGGDYFFRKDFAYNKYRYEKPRLFLRSDDSASVFLNGELVYNGTDRHNGSYWNKKIDTAGVVDISKGGSDVNASSYCSVSGGSTSYGEYIDRVEFNGIDWVSGDNGGYLDATDSISNPSIPGSVYEISVTLNTGGYEEYVSLAFDWDNDGQLSDSDVYRIGSCGSDGCTVSEQIEVPEEASNGSIIMRVMGEWGGYHTDPCSDPNYNEIEDYSATIAGYEENTTGLNESMLRDGTNTLAVELENNDSESAEFDMEFNASITKNRSMIMMSDGEANEETSMTDVPDHDDDGDVDAKDHAIEAGCRAWENYNVTVYAVGFGSGVDNQTLNLTAQCGNGDYYFSSTGELEEVFSNISESIMEASREGQRIEVVKGGLNDTLYPDSYLRLNYSDKESLNFGEFRITQRSPRFGGVVSSPKNGSFYVPQKSKVDSARLLSYSSIYWTDRVSIQNATGSYENVYNLSRYGENYEQLGDPYTVNIPSEKVSVGFENNVSVDTGLNWSDRRGGSPDSMVVYDLLVDGFVGYGKVFSKSEGGSTTVSTDYGSFELEVGNSSDKWDPVNDSIDNATARLLEKLDVDDDNSIDFQMDSEDLEIDGNALKGLEWMWGPVRLSVEVWD